MKQCNVICFPMLQMLSFAHIFYFIIIPDTFVLSLVFKNPVEFVVRPQHCSLYIFIDVKRSLFAQHIDDDLQADTCDAITFS